MPCKYPYKIGDEPVTGYRLVKFLGRGGFGEVWKATAPGGASVSLKVITNLSGVQGRKEFRALRIVKQIQHAHIVPIIAIWLKDGEGNVLDDSFANLDELVFSREQSEDPHQTLTAPSTASDAEKSELIIAMGLGHKNLFNRLEECQAEGLIGVPDSELLDYMEQSARALDYLNGAGHNFGKEFGAVQHCDIKPHNILLVGDAVQICDFGLARVRGEIRATATAAGTVAYAAPECLEDKGTPSESTDQYSLAISYYELKYGKLPYTSTAFIAVMAAVLAGELDFSSATKAEAEVLRKATSRDPAQRYPTSLELVRSLRRAVAGIVTPDGGGSGSAGGFPKALIAIPALILIGAGVWFGSGRSSPRRVDDPTSTNNGSVKVPPVDKGTESTVVVDDAERKKIAAENKAKAAGWLKLVKEDLNGEQFESAFDNFDKAAKLDLDEAQKFDKLREYAVARLKRAESRRIAADFGPAIEDCSQVIAHYPSLGAAYLERGTCYRDQAKYAEALEDLDRAIKLQPTSLAFSRRGFVHLSLGEFDLAVKDCDSAIKLDTEQQVKPSDADYLNRAIANSALKRYDVATEQLQTLIKDSPSSSEAVEAHYQLGLIYQEQRNYKSAISSFEKVIDADPENSDGLAHLALLLACQPGVTDDDAQDAIRMAQKACTAAATKTAAHLGALAAAYASAGRFDDAVKTALEADELLESEKASAEDKAEYAARLERYKNKQCCELPKAEPAKPADAP